MASGTRGLLLRRLSAAYACAAWLGTAGAAAQSLPSEPVTFGSGRVVLGGDVVATLGTADPGFFNYSDYEHGTLREFRAGLTAMVRATDRVSLLGELRSENLGRVVPFALYARVRPWPRRRFDVQIGRIPPTFGRSSRQVYSRDNPLIGSPLGYQYLTSLRADSLPATPDELLGMRGRGWLSNFTVGNTAPARGVPLVTAFTWDTGVQVTTGYKAVSVTGAVTNGTPANPRVSDDNRGKTVAVRVTTDVTAGLNVGASVARGGFVARRLEAAGIDVDAADQRAYGLDMEYARGHWVSRVEGLVSEWRMPFAALGTVATLRATSVMAEGRYAFMPGAFVAVRAERLDFNRLTGSVSRLTWDAPVQRVEIGGGYALQRNLQARLSFQANHRDGGRIRNARFVAAQLLFWF